MYSRFYFQNVFLVALVTATHANIMVESVDGSFVPWRLLSRATSGGLAVRLTNNNDTAYLVSLDDLFGIKLLIWP